MKYLIKDLARISGVSPARIRKWQERYHIFQPHTGANGYHYYTNEDLFLLKRISQHLGGGQTVLKAIKAIQSDTADRSDVTFTPDEQFYIGAVIANRFADIGDRLQTLTKGIGLIRSIRAHYQPLVTLIGRAWEMGYISVADEHAFSRWFHAYIQSKLDGNSPNADWLVVSFPKDEHELGALMHFAALTRIGKQARFCGHLPKEELFHELNQSEYRHLSVSVTVPLPDEEIVKLKNEIHKKFPDLKVHFGGSGYKHRVRPKS